MIKVVMPANFGAERQYIIGVLLGDFLGLPYEVSVGEQASGTYFSVFGRLRLYFPDDLFALREEAWLTEKMVPITAEHIDLGALPFAGEISGQATKLCLPGWSSTQPIEVLFERHEDAFHVNIDLIGAAFFFLSRCEEYVSTSLDQHQRFSASASFATRHGLLGRAVVNEYVEVLWAALKYVAPALVRRQRTFRQQVSHDVDIPFDLLFHSLKRFGKSLAGDLVKRRRPGLAIQRALRWRIVRRGDWAADPYNSFEWIWRQSEARGLESAFYFMAGRTNTARDGEYELEHPAIRRLIRSSAERGHEIGLHPSYESFTSPEIVSREFRRLRRVCDEEGVRQEKWGGRHHYLRWSARETARHWEGAGLSYDSTLGFADRIGFRCGTCYEYPLFDLAERRTLKLRERPLLVMDVSLLAPEYMGMTNLEQALAHVGEIKKVCKRYSGGFTLLWHNDRLATPALKDLYMQCLDI